MSKYQKKRKNKTVLKMVITVIIVGALIAGTLCCGYASRNDAGEWFTNGNLSTWHWNDAQPEPPADDDPNEDQNDETTEETPAEPTAGERVFTKTLSARIVSANAESLYWDFINSNSKNEDKSTEEYISKITVTNNIDGATMTGGDGFHIAWVSDAALPIVATKLFIPLTNPFMHLQEYVFKNVVLTYDDVQPPFHKILDNNFNLYNLATNTVPASSLKQIYVRYELEKDPNYYVPLPDDPVKEGHNFVGWYYGTEEEHGENCRAYDGESITAETNLHAHFEKKQFTVTFDTAGGYKINPLSVPWNSSISPEPATRTGHDFKGWFFEDGTEYTGQNITEDITLTAVWERQKFTVTFYVNGEVYETKTVEYGTTFVEIVEDARKRNLQVLTVNVENGAQIKDYSELQVNENYSVVARELEGTEKVLNTLDINKWYILGGAVAFVVVCCAAGAIITSKRKKKGGKK